MNFAILQQRFQLSVLAAFCGTALATLERFGLDDLDAYTCSHLLGRYSRQTDFNMMDEHLAEEAPIVVEVAGLSIIDPELLDACAVDPFDDFKDLWKEEFEAKTRYVADWMEARFEPIDREDRDAPWGLPT